MPTRILSLLPVLALFSCATILTGTHETIAVTSTPTAANATLTCASGERHEGITPMTVSIRRNAGECRLEVSKDGFQPAATTIISGVNGAFWGNFATSPLVPVALVAVNGFLYTRPDNTSRTWGAVALLTVAGSWLTDVRTGAMHRHTPDKIDVALKPK